MPGGLIQRTAPDKKLVKGSLRKMVHDTVDQLMDSIYEHHADGSSGVFDYDCGNNHTHQIRVMITDITDEEMCKSCGGTGIEESE